MRIRMLIAAVAASLLLSPSFARAADPPARAFKCNLEASGGYSYAAARIADTIANASVDLAADGVIVSAGAGCDIAFSGFVIGALARYHLGKTEAAVDGVAITIDQMWMVAGRAGYQVQPSTLLYALLGYSGASGEVSGIADKRLLGLVYGVGLDARITKALVFRVEWARHDFKGVAIEDARLDPLVNVVRIGVVFDLN